MLDFPDHGGPTSKLLVTHGTLGHVDPKQIPKKRKPYACLLDQRFVHRIELLLPQEIYESCETSLQTRLPTPKFSKVILPLSALLEGDFFNEYIKRGDILMLSEGRFGIDNVYTLHQGILKLQIDRETYERAGLVGKPDGVKGARGGKPRWVVEINLRLPSMLHGKRGFDRIVYAFKKVLTNPVAWLFANLVDQQLQPDPLEAHFPIRSTCTPTITTDIQTTIPDLRPSISVDDPLAGLGFDEYAQDIHEWLSMISLRVRTCNTGEVIKRVESDPNNVDPVRLVHLTWHGLFPSSLAHSIFIDSLQSLPARTWFSMTTHAFSEAWPDESKLCTVMKLPRNEYVAWEPTTRI